MELWRFCHFPLFILDYRTKLPLYMYQNLVTDEREVIPWVRLTQKILLDKFFPKAMPSIGRATCPGIYLFIEIKLLTPASDLHKYVFSSHFIYLCFLHIIRANFTDESILKFKCSGPGSPCPGLTWAILISNQDQGMVNEVQGWASGKPLNCCTPSSSLSALDGPLAQEWGFA